MNWELFAAFLVITAVLVITPGPIVTLVIATGAREGTRAALTTVVGTTLGNAVLLAAIAFGLSWVVRNAATLFEILRWVGAAYLIWLGIQAWRHAGEDSGRRSAARACACLARLRRCAIEPEDDRVFHGILAAVRRSHLAGRTSARGDVCRFGRARRVHRFRLGDRGRTRARMVHAIVAGEAARSLVWRRVDRRRPLAVAGAAAGVVREMATAASSVPRAWLRLINRPSDRGPSRSAPICRYRP